MDLPHANSNFEAVRNVPFNFDLREIAPDHTHEERCTLPCDSVTTQTVSEALKSGIVSLVTDAIKAAGWIITDQDDESFSARKGSVRMTWGKGIGLKVTAANAEISNALIGEIVRSYSKVAVSWAANRAGWTAKSTGNNTVTLSKR